MKYETNIFRIENLKDLSAKYRLVKIVGLNPDDTDYDTNVQYIIETLSYKLKHPVTIINRKESPFLVIKDDAKTLEALPADGMQVRHAETAIFEDTGESMFIDFESQDPAIKQIIIRFLQFDLYGEISKAGGLWLPGSGEAFFSKERFGGSHVVDIFNGFTPRIVELPDGGFGICIDITRKYVAKSPLHFNISKAEFEALKRDRCRFVYHYGRTWYEIAPDEISQLNIAQYKFQRDGKRISLLEDIRLLYNGTLPPDLAKIPDTASVLVYRNNAKEAKGAVAAMCYRTYDTEDPQVAKLHRQSIINPFERRKLVRTVVSKFFSNLKYGSKDLRISSEPWTISLDIFEVPDLLFKNDIVLSTRGTRGSNMTTIDTLGYNRKQLLLNKHVGFYTNAPFDAQFMLIPESIFNTYGNQKHFVKDLAEYVNRMHPTEKGWLPKIIPYDDRNKRTALDIGLEILDKLKEDVSARGGYAVVVLPSRLERQKKMHDEAAGLVVSQCLSEYQINASIMHTEILENCFEYKEENGKVQYSIKADSSSRFEKLYRRYLAGVAINQVLLNNERWPFILSTPLHADLVIGIDVKEHVAGFTFIDKQSKNILPHYDISKNKERLSTDQVTKVLVEKLRILISNIASDIKRITFHRDGRLYRTEILGIENAIKLLVDEGLLPDDVSYNLIEIPKNSVIPFRMIEVTRQYDIFNQINDNGAVLNPRNGAWTQVNAKEAFIITTGREFARQGTSHPLFVRYVRGDMSFKDVLEDIYFLSHLAFTKPDDCSRNPLTIKITDRRINLLGSEYDAERMELLKTINLN